MAINPNGMPPGYYQPGAYPQQGGQPMYGPGQTMGPGYAPDVYGGVQAPPPGQGMNSMMGGGGGGGGLGGLFGMIGGLINSIIDLVKSVVTGVINLVMSIVTAIFKPILGLFGIGGSKDKQSGGGGGAPAAPPAAPMPLFNQSNEAVMTTANSTLQQYRDIVTAAQSNQNDAKTVDWFAVMAKADTDFQAQREALAKAYGPSSAQVMSFDGACQQVKTDMKALAGSSASPSAAKNTAANPNDLSSLQLPNDPNLLQMVRNLQLLMACPAQAKTLSASDRAEVDQGATQMQQQITTLQATNPQLAGQLAGFFAKFQTDWAAAKAANPPAAQSTTAPAADPNANAGAPASTGRKYRDIPLDLPGDPAPTTTKSTKTPVPADLGGA